LPIGGEEVWFAGTVSPMTEDRVVFVAREVTKRKRADQSLRETEACYGTLGEQIRAVLYMAYPTTPPCIAARR